MFCFFIATVLGLQYSNWSYNAEKPFSTKNFTDIASDWSLVGNPITTKSFIRLTSALENSYGGICQQKPTVFRDWTAEFEIRAHRGNGGDGFWFFFSEEFCVANNYEIGNNNRNEKKVEQILPKNWDGFILWINTSAGSFSSPVYLIQSRRDTPIDYHKRLPLGSFPIRGDIPVKIKVTRKGDEVRARFQREYQVYTFEQTFEGLPEQGYFSFLATTTEFSDDNDLISFNITRDSEIKEEYTKNVPQTITKTNRNTIMLSKETRRMKKRARSATMKESFEYDAYRKEKKNKLDGKGYNFNDLPKMIDETTIRARSTITNKMLYDFMIPEIEKSIAVATLKINLQMERFKETKESLDDMWLNVKNTLQDLSMEARINMTNLGREAADIASKITLKGADEGEGRSNNINDVVADESQKGSSFIPFVCICICFVEFVVYATWFNNKRIRTMNFKKAD